MPSHRSGWCVRSCRGEEQAKDSGLPEPGSPVASLRHCPDVGPAYEPQARGLDVLDRRERNTGTPQGIANEGNEARREGHRSRTSARTSAARIAAALEKSWSALPEAAAARCPAGADTLEGSSGSRRTCVVRSAGSGKTHVLSAVGQELVP